VTSLEVVQQQRVKKEEMVRR